MDIEENLERKFQKMKMKILKKNSIKLKPIMEPKKEEFVGNIIFSKTKFLNSKSRTLLKNQKFRLLKKPGPKIKNILNEYKRTNTLDPLLSSGIYRIQCDNCPKGYIGQTARSIKTRSKEHLDSVNMGGGNYRKTWADITKKSEEDTSGFIKHITKAAGIHTTDRSKVTVLEKTQERTLDIKETQYIQEANLDNLMNLKPGPLHNTSTFNLYMELRESS